MPLFKFYYIIKVFLNYTWTVATVLFLFCLRLSPDQGTLDVVLAVVVGTTFTFKNFSR